MLVASLHITSWVGKPLKRELEYVFRAPVRVENDTALVGLREAVRGAGQGYPIGLINSAFYLANGKRGDV
ncbi:MAG: hypothetical protein A3D64_01030 [Candidatus Wildermuthbacteria bacterium RIFCSPHIGHO2_02_FULL_49_9]|uniref:Uncharacterized protein n=2 Tax=Candidatus Wildermuthiibacteriota TaxID=1817923 RepID=A0A1G2R0N2_9BACT|nr:MAG: hypothetical protein A2672_02540 [Candidatus Wildermuthbacteria bacterium RIFCSPHIGHO2_01_FULL_49_22b]OHA70726.1 MAG: hypothetical protein A3D64_01030 [Candidatus Wildermuthbacteria bacterium RIFCSPHIGHO2_02_FULL_49_9]